MVSGRATPASTQRYAHRFDHYLRFYRPVQNMLVSSLGIGTYLGQPDAETSRAYTRAVVEAVRGGINFIDTSLNYRGQRSEIAIGEALVQLAEAGVAQRDELVLCTKAGYLIRGAVPDGLDPDQIAGGMHSMDARFLSDQLERSLRNLAVETIDVFYLHNPETQLDFVSREIYEARLRSAFEAMERFVQQEKIAWYGMATWTAFRQEGSVPLARILELAGEAGGADHHFRFVQLPFNLAMTEGLTLPNQQSDAGAISFLEAAARLGVAVAASASLLQSRLIGNIPAELAATFAGLDTDAQRALQFTRSTPRVTVALAGMSDPAHVAENLGIAKVPPLATEEYVKLYRASA